jgi:hypothetical protein
MDRRKKRYVYKHGECVCERETEKRKMDGQQRKRWMDRRKEMNEQEKERWTER